MAGGAEYNERAVTVAIMQYIEGWFAGTIPDEVLTRQLMEDKAAKEATANRTHGGGLWKHG